MGSTHPLARSETVDRSLGTSPQVKRSSERAHPTATSVRSLGPATDRHLTRLRPLDAGCGPQGRARRAARRRSPPPAAAVWSRQPRAQECSTHPRRGCGGQECSHRTRRILRSASPTAYADPAPKCTHAGRLVDEISDTPPPAEGPAHVGKPRREARGVSPAREGDRSSSAHSGPTLDRGDQSCQSVRSTWERRSREPGTSL